MLMTAKSFAGARRKDFTQVHRHADHNRPVIVVEGQRRLINRHNQNRCQVSGERYSLLLGRPFSREA